MARASPSTVIAKFGAEQRVVDLVVFRSGLQVLGHGQESGVLARAVVVQLAGFFERADQPVAFGMVVGFMRATAEVGFGKAQIGKPAPGHADMQIGAIMAGTGES